MTYTQFRMALAKLDMTQSYMAFLLGARDRTVRCWALNERAMPPQAIALVHLLLDKKIKPNDLAMIWRKKYPGGLPFTGNRRPQRKKVISSERTSASSEQPA